MAERQLKQGFTLIELLVVIAIISLLMAILTPVLGKARQLAYNVICQSNLRQYGIADMMYLDDNDGFFPYTFEWLFKDGDGGETIFCRWHEKAAWPPTGPSPLLPGIYPNNAGTLWPYLEKKDCHMCPMFGSAARQRGCPNCIGSPSSPIAVGVEPHYSYSKNAYLNGDGHNPVKKISEVRKPASVVNFTEENTWYISLLTSAVLNDNNFRNRGDGTFPFGPPLGGGGDVFATYHKYRRGDMNTGYANAVFVDGHVEHVSIYDWDSRSSFYLCWPYEK